jgi:hypothetical protein
LYASALLVKGEQGVYGRLGVEVALGQRGDDGFGLGTKNR